MKLAINFYLVLVLLLLWLGACSTTTTVDLAVLPLTATPEHTEIFEPTSTIQSSPTKILLPIATISTPTAVVAFATPTIVKPSHTPIPEASPNHSITQLIQIDAIPPEPRTGSNQSENTWWSDDSQTLFYQNVETQEAWAYDVKTDISTPITYTVRTLGELKDQLSIDHSDLGFPISISPYNRYVLFLNPIEPIPLDPPRFDNDFNPAYTYELWLLKDGEAHNLGLVDACFALLWLPHWSLNENKAIVDTYGIPDMPRACMYHGWLIDIENLQVNPITIDGEVADGYIPLNLSADGDFLLVGATGDNRKHYLINLNTGQKQAIPNTYRESSGVLLGSGEDVTTLVFKLRDEFPRDSVWQSRPGTVVSNLIATIDGPSVHQLISPDQKFMAFFVYHRDSSGSVDSRETPSLWLLRLPE